MNKDNARVDIMVDVETLGNKPDSTIIQIAAANFDITTGKTIDIFNECCDISKEDINVTGGTLKWWLKTDKDLLEDILNRGNISPSKLLKEFKLWLLSESICSYDDVYLWGNGILFDNNLLQTQMKAAGLNYPISYRNDRDLRTAVELAAMKSGLSNRDFIERHSLSDIHKHDAMDDVYSQVKLLHESYKILSE